MGTTKDQVETRSWLDSHQQIFQWGTVCFALQVSYLC